MKPLPKPQQKLLRVLPDSNLFQGCDLLREKQVARILGVSPFKLQRDRCNGTGIPFLRLGRMIRYRPAEVLAYIDKHDPKIAHQHGLTDRKYAQLNN